MATEIERKFLLASDGWRSQISHSTRIAQGYLNEDPARTVRIRIKGQQGFLTIKGKNAGISRLEFEYSVPLEDAQAILALCPNVLDKTRHIVEIAGFCFEIDEFHGENAGLIVAEIELPSEEATFPQPAWLGKEVSAEPRYYNSALSTRPYAQWPDIDK